MQLILWPGGAYTDNTYATKPESWSHIRIHFMNHDYIGSFWQCQMRQKTSQRGGGLCHLNSVKSARFHEIRRISARNSADFIRKTTLPEMVRPMLCQIVEINSVAATLLCVVKLGMLWFGFVVFSYVNVDKIIRNALSTGY